MITTIETIALISLVISSIKLGIQIKQLSEKKDLRTKVSNKDN